MTIYSDDLPTVPFHFPAPPVVVAGARPSPPAPTPTSWLTKPVAWVIAAATVLLVSAAATVKIVSYEPIDWSKYPTQPVTPVIKSCQ